jgi:hypothetical protein
MPEDNDSKALRLAGAALFAMEVKIRNAGVMERVAFKQQRDDLWNAYHAAREQLIAQDVIVGEAELAELAALKDELEDAASTNATAATVLKLVGFFARF